MIISSTNSQLDCLVDFMKARWLIKVWNSGKLGQLVYQRGISGVDAIEKIAQMLSPTSEDSLLILKNKQ